MFYITFMKKSAVLRAGAHDVTTRFHNGFKGAFPESFTKNHNKCSFLKATNSSGQLCQLMF